MATSKQIYRVAKPNFIVILNTRHGIDDSIFSEQWPTNTNGIRPYYDMIVYDKHDMGAIRLQYDTGGIWPITYDTMVLVIYIRRTLVNTILSDVVEILHEWNGWNTSDVWHGGNMTYVWHGGNMTYVWHGWNMMRVEYDEFRWLKCYFYLDKSLASYNSWS